MKAQTKFTTTNGAGRLASIEGHTVPASFPRLPCGPLSFSKGEIMKTKTILKTDYSAKKCKEMEGHDGYVIRFDLCYKDKKVAEVFDGGYGGDIDFEWDKSFNEAKGELVPYLKGAKQDFNILVKQLGKCKPPYEDLDYSADILVMEIYEDQRMIKQLKRLLKNKVLFINKDDGKCGEFSWKGCKAITQKHIDVVKKDCKEVKVILNELDFSEAFVQFKKAIS